MANCALAYEKALAAKIKYGTLSGTVKKDSVGIVRDLIVYNKADYETVIASGQSVITTGVFSIKVPGGTNDLFRMLCIGESGENSAIYENLKIF